MKWLDRILGGRDRPDAGTALLRAGHEWQCTFPTGGPQSVARLSGIAHSERAAPRGALVRFDFFDGEGRRVPGPYPGIRRTRRHGPHLLFPIGPGGERFSLYVMVPRAAVSVVLTFRARGRNEVALADVALDMFDPSTVVDADADSDPSLLRILHRRAVISGEISAATEIARRIHAASDMRFDRGALDRALGIMRELDTGWAPTIPEELRLSGPPQRNKICHLFKVTYPYENSGGAIRGLNLVNSLRSAGYESIVLTPLFYPSTPIATRRQSLDGTVYYNLALPGGSRDAPIDVRLQYDALLTASIIAREAPAIIHAASGYRGYELALKALPIGARLGIPVIYEVRSFHEHLWGARGTMESEWTRLRMAQEERCMREAACVVTISQAMRKALVGRGVPEEKIHVVPNAVGDEFLEPAPPTGPALRQSLGIGDGTTVIGYVSNLSRREGHVVLIRAVARLHAAGRDIRCLIVGDGPIRDHLEEIAQKQGIADRTIFTGEVDHQKVRSYYEAIDIFVVPRRADYAADYVTPLKPFEALALGRPLIMSDRPVASEIVGDEERGLLFKTGDADHLAATIARLLDDPDRRRALVDAGRKWVETERTWRRNAEAYRGIYENVLSGPSRTSNR